MLPTVATDGARLVRVMLSLTLPSPLIFTVNGLPARTEKALMSSPEAEAQHRQKTQASHGEGGGGRTHQVHARQRTWWRQCKCQAPWGSRRPCRCHLPGPPSGCPLCWDLPLPRICHRNLQHGSPGLMVPQLTGAGELNVVRKDGNSNCYFQTAERQKWQAAPIRARQAEEQVKGSEKSCSENTCWVWFDHRIIFSRLSITIPPSGYPTAPAGEDTLATRFQERHVLIMSGRSETEFLNRPQAPPMSNQGTMKGADPKF